MFRLSVNLRVCGARSGRDRIVAEKWAKRILKIGNGIASRQNVVGDVTWVRYYRKLHVSSEQELLK